MSFFSFFCASLSSSTTKSKIDYSSELSMLNGNHAHEEPLSLDEILKSKSKTNGGAPLKKVKFLSKSQRDKIKQEGSKVVKPVIKAKQKVQLDYDNDNNGNLDAVPSHNTTIKRDNKNDFKFKFEWDAKDDTSSSYNPIVEQKKTELLVNEKSTKKEDTRPWDKKPLNEMTARDWRIMREDFNINSKGSNIAFPLRNWSESKLSPFIIEELQRLGYKHPTPIQRAAIPMGLEGRDVVGIAETGSGKTLAFVLPILNYIQKLPPLREYDPPYVLILVPTRELALQIEKVITSFHTLGLKVASLIGGHSYNSNIEKLQRGVEIVVGTPGRLLDCLEKNILSLSECFFLAMDEADKMIDMGFEVQVNKVLDELPPGSANKYFFGEGPKKRVTMMFTATMPPAIEKMTSKYLDSPGMVMIGEVGEAVDSIIQDAILAPDETKRMEMLPKILENFKAPIIIFANYKKTCEDVSQFLEDRGWNTIVMHGSKTQEQREHAIKKMKSGEADILIATDVAGRGIDIPDVSLVLNYQMSRSIEDYTHRIGRTGRKGKKGNAITFWGPEDADVLYALKVMISKSSASKVPSSLRNSEYTMKPKVREIDN